MRHLLLLWLVRLASCSTYRLADEPADLVAPGRRMPELLRLGWEISQPIQSTHPDLPGPEHGSMSNGKSWASFVAKLGPSDELRPVRNNAGIGYAVFRGGMLVDMFLTTIF